MTTCRSGTKRHGLRILTRKRLRRKRQSRPAAHSRYSLPPIIPGSRSKPRFERAMPNPAHNSTPPVTAKRFALDRDGDPIACRLKVVSGDGLNTLRSWLDDDADVLFLGDKRSDPLVLMDLDTWKRLAPQPEIDSKA